ncbi:ERAP1-like C-terminal domain-containing protein [Pseudoalteromonas sp. MMG010]|uniref:M1 family metallopeptidase n=1 Tax=Pseudoalteromonas sp. MMG010 TaxID=2822685 RepID=UPI001B39F9EC|nr:M1 family metallopeptidase [Pseudoalteromonas sp. MMG010]MBQ4833867.1 ERAP1-like C-terminal domain-containing protein [Pseudoalteromonas sp. MMG010]
MFLKSLITLSVALGMSSANANEFVIEKLAKPSSQKVSLTLDPSKDTFSGVTEIALEVLKPTKYIELNGVDYATSMVQLLGDKNCDLSTAMLKTGKVKLSCDEQIQAGKYTLKIDFSAPYNRQSVGLYKTLDQGTPYLFTQFEMSDARRAFPVFDEPSYKIPFQLTITAPTSQKVYANTPELKTTTNGDMTTHYFDKTPPIPSYLVAMAVGPFEELKIEGMPIPGRVITPQGKIHLADYAKQNMPKVLAALEDYFGIDYVYKKLDSVAVPEFPFGAMENSGLVTYREDILLVDLDTATRSKKQRNVSIIAHELAHQWYGNLVTMKWWNDLWLNEAFASWMAAKITKQLNPEFESHLDLPQNRVMPLDARLSTKPIRKPIKTEADIMDGLGLAYSKGSAVLSMVENWIGEEVFQKGIRSYMKKFSFKNAEAADLWQALGEASNKDVASVLKSFIEQSSYPLIKVTAHNKQLIISQSRFANAGVDAPEQLWNVPVAIKYGAGDKVKTVNVLLSEQSQTIDLDFEPQWIYPDQGALGYYRWVLDDTQFSALIDNAAAKLTDRERLALLSATDALLDAGVISAAKLMQTLEVFASDSHPRVANTALGYLASQQNTFKDESNKALWPEFIRSAVTPAAKQYGLEAKAGEDGAISQLRAAVVARLGFDGEDKTIINKAKQQTQLYLTNPQKVDPYLASTYLKLAALHGDKALLTQFTNEFVTTKDPQVRTNMLSAMGYFGKPALQKEVLAYSLTDAVTASDMRTILAGQSYTEERQALFIDWIYANYDKVTASLPPFFIPNLPYFTTANCNAKSLATTQQFFNKKVEEVPGYARTLSKLQESTQDCIALKKREIKSVNSFLNAK